MDAGGSYRLREHFHDVEAELRRLEAQATHPWPKEADVLERRGVAPDARVLEVGCGPGFVTERLLTLVPAGAVTAIDSDPDMVELARQRLAGFDRVEVLEASVTDTGFADAAFDLATARLVFQHLSDPVAALAELHRVLRPGGRLSVTDVDGDWGVLFDPEPPHLDEINDAYRRMRAERGANRTIGRKLPRLLAEARFHDLAFDVVVLHSFIDGRETADILGAMELLEQLADAGLMDKRSVEEVREFSDRFERGELEVDAVLALLIVSGEA